MGDIIAVIGLGYVGLPLAVEFGKKRVVIGFDVSSERIFELGMMIDKTMEVDESSLLAAEHLSFTCDESQLGQAQIYIITVPTPVDGQNIPDMSFLVNASHTVGRYLKKGDIVIYESTVYPGATEEVCVPILSKVSGLIFNKDFFCGYSPERINPGDKLHKLADIKKITSGSTPEIAKRVDDLYSEIIVAGTFSVSSIKVAEAAKVIENTQRDLNIAYMNELSIIFSKMGLDTNEVLEAAGTKWNFLPFRPGLVGGHCIGVDPFYLTYKASQLGYHPKVILAGREINDGMAEYAGRQILAKLVQNGTDLSVATVSILGVTFKEDCPDIRNSKVFDLIAYLKKNVFKVLVWDPIADPAEVLSTYGVELIQNGWPSLVDGVVIAVAHRSFYSFKINDFRSMFHLTARPVVADLKSILNRDELINSGIDVFRL